MDPAKIRHFEAAGVLWSVYRDSGVCSGFSDAGYAAPAGYRGFRFSSSTGERRFVELPITAFPNEDQFHALSEESLTEYLAQATSC